MLKIFTTLSVFFIGSVSAKFIPLIDPSKLSDQCHVVVCDIGTIEPCSEYSAYKAQLDRIVNGGQGGHMKDGTSYVFDRSRVELPVTGKVAEGTCDNVPIKIICGYESVPFKC